MDRTREPGRWRQFHFPNVGVKRGVEVFETAYVAKQHVAGVVRKTNIG